MKIYVHGKEDLGTSIDNDNKRITEIIQEDLGHKISDIKNSDIVLSVWWNSTPITNKKTIIFVSNFIKKDSIENFQKFLLLDKKISPIWMCPSQKQIEEIIDFVPSKRLKFCPFYVNKVYSKSYHSKKSFLKENFSNHRNFFYISKKNNEIKTYEDLKRFIHNKKIIGSFQRDSEGSDLLKPKWQKGPDNLIKWAKEKNNEIIFLISGPRRHYICNELIKNNIDFIYFGDYSFIQDVKDDIKINTFNEEVIYNLYLECDGYLIGSKSEGGPKSAIECAYLKIPVLSTNVGLVNHFINKDYIVDEVFSKDFNNFLNDIKKEKYSFKEDFVKYDFCLNSLKEAINEN